MTRLGVLVVALSVGAPSIVRGECRLRSARGEIEHVVYIVFDNMHLRRDDPNVPSDLEQMPNLLNFLTQQGTLLTNHHTPLISHTATDILTGLTGVYGDRHGVPVSNSFRYFNPDGTSNPGVSFAYWTAPIFDPSNPLVPTDTTPNMLTREGLNAPAPWVPYTRAGCDFATAANPNIVLENIAIDIPTVFGPDSPEAHEAMDDPPQAFADFVGIGLHCAIDSPRCAEAQNGKPDPLPDEPGGYVGYRGLFGHVYVAPLLDPSGPLRDLDGNIIDDGHGHIGFPGFDGMHARVTPLVCGPDARGRHSSRLRVYFGRPRQPRDESSLWAGRSRLCAGASRIRPCFRSVFCPIGARRHQLRQHPVRDYVG